jgi:hypothetical protein
MATGFPYSHTHPTSLSLVNPHLPGPVGLLSPTPPASLTQHHCCSHRAGHHWSPPGNRSSLWETEATEKIRHPHGHTSSTCTPCTPVDRSVCTTYTKWVFLGNPSSPFKNRSKFQGLGRSGGVNCRGPAPRSSASSVVYEVRTGGQQWPKESQRDMYIYAWSGCAPAQIH